MLIYRLFKEVYIFCYDESMNIPLICIQTSPLLFNSISEEERNRWASETGMPLIDMPSINQYVKEFKLQWGLCEEQIIGAMYELYGVQFKKQIIDVYVSPWNRSISNPLIINPSRPPKIHIDTLVHELLHGLFTDNSSFSMHDKDQSVKLIDKWRELFGDDLEWKTVVHIPVHAGLKAIFLDTLHAPDRLTRDIERHINHPTYKAAWDYVEELGYKEINEKLRKLYKSLA
jgi:hypothetical protein